MDIIESVLPFYLDLYVQYDLQDADTGALKKSWQFYKTIPCSAKGIVSNSSASRSGDKQVLDNRYHNEQYIEIRTVEKISIRNKIFNIRNKQNDPIWTELNYPTETPTVFEVVGITPLTDPFGIIVAYNVRAKRSESQQIGI